MEDKRKITIGKLIKLEATRIASKEIKEKENLLKEKENLLKEKEIELKEKDIKIKELEEQIAELRRLKEEK